MTEVFDLVSKVRHGSGVLSREENGCGGGEGVRAQESSLAASGAEMTSLLR